MTRTGTLPAGVADAVSQFGYRARHAVVIGTPTSLRWCDGPTPLTIGVDVYQPGAITPSSIALVGLPSIRVRVPNTANEVSQPDADGTLIKASLKVYEVHWSAAGAQLSELPLFDGEVTTSDCEAAGADIGAKARVAGTAGMVGRTLGRLCHYGFKDGRCGMGTYGFFIGAPTFARASTAYKQNGSSVSSNAPRYEAAKYSNGVTVEEGCTNLVASDNAASIETDATGWAVSGSTITRQTSEYWHGAASLRQVCTAAAQYCGLVTRPAASAGNYYTVSVWIKGENGKTAAITINFYNSVPALLSESADATLNCDGTWQRVYVTGLAPATTATLNIKVYNRTAGAHTMYIDGAQVRLGAYPLSWTLPSVVRTIETLTIPQAAVNDAAGTFEAWIKLLRAPGANEQYVLDANGAASHGLRLYVGTGAKLTCVYGNGAGDTTITGSTTTLAAGTLYHVAVKWSSSGAAIYVGGSPEGSDATAPAIVAGALVYLGSKADGTLQLDGILDDIRIENNARSDAEIAADAASGTALSATAHTLYKLPLDSNLSHSEGAAAGEGKTCDRRIEACTVYGNQLRFGGWPSMPEKGKKWAYTVTSPQPLFDRSGTIAPPQPPPTPPPVTPPGFPRLKLPRGG